MDCAAVDTVACLQVLQLSCAWRSSGRSQPGGSPSNRSYFEEADVRYRRCMRMRLEPYPVLPFPQSAILGVAGGTSYTIQQDVQLAVRLLSDHRELDCLAIGLCAGTSDATPPLLVVEGWGRVALSGGAVCREPLLLGACMVSLGHAGPALLSALAGRSDAWWYPSGPYGMHPHPPTHRGGQ